MVYAAQLLAKLLREGLDVRRFAPAEVHWVAVLIEADADRVRAGADEVLLDLLVRALDGGDDGDDRGDADDDAEHGEEAAELMRPDAAEGKKNIL